MKPYVLDTMVVAALMRGDGPAIDALEAAGRTRVFIPQPVIAEIAYGVARLPKSKKKTSLQAEFERIRREVRRALWTDPVSEAFASIKAALARAGVPLEDFDMAIAAHAVAREAVLATGNLRHMNRIPNLELEDWTTRAPE